MGFTVTVSNGERLKVLLYLVADEPSAVLTPGSPAQQRYQWNSIRRAQCSKGCSGPILRAIQRFSSQGR